MFRTLVRRAHVHKPGFRFPDRKAPKEAHVPHPHPAAPPNVADNFQKFQQAYESGPHFDPSKLNDTASASASSSSSSSAAGGAGSSSGLLGNISMSGREVAEDTHLLPERFWRTPALVLGDEEMESIMLGGAARS
ncbi:uncharacterized protein PFL1_06757 [Pseudozyma flocculosa PF-1]|uniref:Uncharacterized protein n=2 Tax=Pseudozyma flocculosa TaxID=84751 RepID=A0A5C3FAJ1_9BASI|nr:uncharacterized protein PFL1_06757 [Pseudozyma flocculosa PF-1]EPQ25685.1 hypothetical protein PFL1_06757 [Pseudozyma flocculosa PF-1]SPO40461.1 uncharacterized protein PSFLO_05943 [Pseudozyma flocculosa]